jgi:hypothetical protein
VRRAAAIVSLAAGIWAALACGKYGQPVRAEHKPEPAQSEEPSEEAAP